MQGKRDMLPRSGAAAFQGVPPATPMDTSRAEAKMAWKQLPSKGYGGSQAFQLCVGCAGVNLLERIAEEQPRVLKESERRASKAGGA